VAGAVVGGPCCAVPVGAGRPVAGFGLGRVAWTAMVGSVFSAPGLDGGSPGGAGETAGGGVDSGACEGVDGGVDRS